MGHIAHMNLSGTWFHILCCHYNALTTLHPNCLPDIQTDYKEIKKSQPLLTQQITGKSRDPPVTAYPTDYREIQGSPVTAYPTDYREIQGSPSHCLPDFRTDYREIQGSSGLSPQRTYRAVVVAECSFFL
jgi:hypothetical protein